jgi:hypothetical protein
MKRRTGRDTLGSIKPFKEVNMERAIDQVARFGGLLFGIFAMAGFTLVSTSSYPDPTQPPAEQYAHLLANPPGIQFWAGVGLESLGILLLLTFAIRVARITAESNPKSWLPSLAVAAAVTSTAIKVGSFAPALEAINHAQELGADTTVALIGINSIASNVTLGVDAVWLTVTAAALLSATRVPRWLGWTALAAAGGMGAASVGVDAGQLPALLWFAAAIALRRTAVGPLPAAAEEGSRHPAVAGTSDPVPL